MKKILYIILSLTLSVSMQAQIDRSVQPKPGPSPKVNLGKPQSFKLPNGLTVLVVENHKLPRVTFSLSLDNPPYLEGEIKGVDDLTSNMMGNGTSKISKDAFNEKIDFYGASVYFSTSNVGGTTLSRYFADVLSLASQGALDPLFTQEELDSERAKLLDELKTQEKNTKNIAGRVRKALVYGKDHPRGEVLRAETINKVTLADIKTNYSNYFVPENAYLVIVGDVKFSDVKNLVTKNFSSWKKAVAPKTPYFEPTNLSKTEIDFVDVPHAVQTEILINNVVSLKMTDPDYFAALLANQILGGGSDGYLFTNLREGHGWTYGSYSNINGDKRISDFNASASVRNAVTDSAVVEMLHEINRIRTELPTQSALDLAKAKYVGNFVMNAEKPQTIASFALREKTQLLPANFYENYIKNINAVTLDQVQAAAKKYILRDASRLVIAGKASEILPKLEALNIPIKYYDSNANLTSKPVAKTLDSSITPQSILQKYIDAIGGEKAIAAIKTISITNKASVQGQEMTTLQKQTSAGKYLQEMSIMGMSLSKIVYDGTTGTITVQGQKKPLEGDELENVKLGIIPEIKQLSSTTIKVSGIEKIGDSDAYKVVDGKRASFYDVKTGLKTAEEATAEAGGQQITQRVILSDYREINGIKIPYKMSMNVMGMEIENNVTDIKINSGVADSDFK